MNIDNQRGSLPEAEYTRLRKTIEERAPYLDRIRGCMIGGAVGDALGWPVEFRSEPQIFDRYWPNGIVEYELNREGVAEITDDTQMALFTANGILYGETRDALQGTSSHPRRYVAVAYQDWMDTQEPGLKPGGISWLLDVRALWARRAPGGTCLNALRLQNKAPGMIQDYVEAALNNSKGCGGVMRVAPMGLRNWADIKALDYEGAQLAAITHGHSLGYMPAAVLVHIINRIVFADRQAALSLKDIILEARDTVAEIFSGDAFLPRLRAIIDRAVELAEHSTNSDLENIHELGEGWVAEETLAIALYCALKYENDFSRGVIASVNHKGDSDSTGAVTGNILGALAGYDAIEAKWKEKLELRDVILEMSDDLCYGCLMTKHGKYTDPGWKRKYKDGHWRG